MCTSISSQELTNPAKSVMVFMYYCILHKILSLLLLRIVLQLSIVESNISQLRLRLLWIEMRRMVFYTLLWLEKKQKPLRKQWHYIKHFRRNWKNQYRIQEGTLLRSSYRMSDYSSRASIDRPLPRLLLCLLSLIVSHLLFLFYYCI